MVTTLSEFMAEHTQPAAGELVESLSGGAVRCLACAHRCRITDGHYGVCRVRVNRAGTLHVASGYVAGLQLDPIEKKPFFHVYPGTDAISFGMLGCNLHCSFCQNWISTQMLREKRSDVMPSAVGVEQIKTLAERHRPPVCVSTYNEPLITTEWAVAIFDELRPLGVRGGFVSNGYATREVLEYLRPHMDLYKVDLKCFDERNYRTLGGSLQPVLDTIGWLKELDYWVEVVTLVIPGFNDSDAELGRIARFLAGVSPDIPWHVTAFHPDYQMTDTSATPASTLLRACEIGKQAGLNFVYAGNLPGRLGSWENTRCPHCDALLIERWGLQTRRNRLADGRCPDCNTPIPGVW